MYFFSFFDATILVNKDVYNTCRCAEYRSQTVEA